MGFFPTLKKAHGIEALFFVSTYERAFDIRPKWLYKRAASQISMLCPLVEGLNLIKILIVGYIHVTPTVPASKLMIITIIVIIM